MEIKVGQTVAKQETLTRELPCLPARKGDADILGFSAVDFRLLDAREVTDGLGNAILQLGNCRLVICELQSLFAGQARRRVQGVIGGRSHLARQVEHVG